MIRPGRGDITTIRVDRNTASGIEWVTNTTVLPVSAHRRQQLCVELVAHDLVQRSERLVHEQQLRIERQRASDRGPLLHTARELPGVLVLEALQVDHLQPARRALAPLRRRQAHHLERQHHVALDRAPREQRRRLEHVAVLPAEPRLLGADAVDPDRARARPLQIGDDPQQRGLAAAGRADQRDEVAVEDGKVDLGQRVDRAVSGGEGERNPVHRNHGRCRLGNFCSIRHGGDDGARSSAWSRRLGKAPVAARSVEPDRVAADEDQLDDRGSGCACRSGSPPSTSTASCVRCRSARC